MWGNIIYSASISIRQYHASLTFWGATGQVTGSCYVLETNSSNILLDCGLLQGSGETEKQNEQDFPFDPTEIDAVVLSHAHLDHCGRLPKLVKNGFKGQLFLTEAGFPLLSATDIPG